MDDCERYEFAQMLMNLPIRPARKLEHPEIVQKMVAALVLVDINAEPESQGVSFRDPGIDPFTEPFCQTVITAVDLRFLGSTEVPADEAEDTARRQGPSLLEMADRIPIYLRGGLSHAETVSKVIGLLEILEVAEPDRQVVSDERNPFHLVRHEALTRDAEVSLRTRGRSVGAVVADTMRV